MNVSAPITSASAGPRANEEPIWAMFNAPVRAYNSPIPVRIKNAPTLLETAKFSVPVSGPSSSMSYAVSAYADTETSSKKTNRLNRSPVRQNPTAPARNTSISTWNSGPTTEKYRYENRNAITN